MELADAHDQRPLMRNRGLVDVAGGVRRGAGRRIVMRHNRDAARRSGESEGVFAALEGRGIAFPRFPQGVLWIARAEFALKQGPVIPGIAIDRKSTRLN